MKENENTSNQSNYKIEIEINKNESYNLIIPQFISKDSFFEIVNRLNHIQKIIGKDPLNQMTIKDEVPFVPKHSSGFHMKDFTNREQTIELLTDYYSKGSKELILKKYGYVKSLISTQSLRSLRDRFNVNPNDVGLVNWPTRGKGQCPTRLGGNNENATN